VGFEEYCLLLGTYTTEVIVIESGVFWQIISLEWDDIIKQKPGCPI